MNPKLKKALIVIAVLVALYLLYRWFTRTRCNCAQNAPITAGGGGGSTFMDIINPFTRPNSPGKPVAPHVNPKSSGGGDNITFAGEAGNIVSGSGFTISSTNTTSTNE